MKYWVDEANGVCVCKMMGNEETGATNADEAVDYICGRLVRRLKSSVGNLAEFVTYNNSCQYWLKGILRPYITKHIKDEYCGVARCSGDDKFVSTIGIELARARCLKEFYRDAETAAHSVWKILTQLAIDTGETEDKAFNSEDFWRNVEEDLV